MHRDVNGGGSQVVLGKDPYRTGESINDHLGTVGNMSGARYGDNRRDTALARDDRAMRVKPA